MLKTLLLVLLSSTLCLAEYSTYRTVSNRVSYSARDNLEWTGYSYSVDEGHCDGTKLVDEDVQKDADPYTYKKTTYTWTGRGLFTITCVRVLNRMPRDSNAAEARITTGGVGQQDVRIEMRSQDSQRTHFHVEIWGKEKSGRASNVAIMSPGTGSSSVLYMNGKKYCECR